MHFQNFPRGMLPNPLAKLGVLHASVFIAVKYHSIDAPYLFLLTLPHILFKVSDIMYIHL